MSHQFEDYDVRWLEEPVLADNIDGMSEIVRATKIPVASGENEYSIQGFKELITRGGSDIVQPDVGRVGGVSEWMKVAAMADAFGLLVAPHGVPDVHIHMCMGIRNLKAVEYFEGGWVREGRAELTTDVPQPVNGMWAPDPDKLGIGFDLLNSAVDKYSVD